jgi:hypothetical protein
MIFDSLYYLRVLCVSVVNYNTPHTQLSKLNR